MSFIRLASRSLPCCAWAVCAVVLAQSPDQTLEQASDSSSSSAPDAPQVVDEAVVEAELATQELSSAAQIRLDRARDSVVQIRGFYGGSESSAFHGSGFAVRMEGPVTGLIVTNYHVVSEAVLHPRQYRLEYIAADGRTGGLQVYAIDVKNDLAIVKADALQLPPLRLRPQIPRQGERAYSIGFPLNLGLTITEGVANGMVANSFEQRIHYTGAINGGMSGGPALDANGAVYGVNVSVVTGRQLVGFVIPAKHIQPLLARAREPLNSSNSPRQARELVAAQALVHQAGIFASMLEQPGTQTVSGYTLPTRISPSTECSTVGNMDAHPQLSVETINCAIRARLLAQPGLEIGDIIFQHRILRSQSLHPLQFTRQVNGAAAAYKRSGSDKHVAAFACENSLVSLDGFDARVSTCARQYRLFANLYDIAVTVVSINSTQQAVISQLDLRGVAFEPGMQFVRRYLRSMRWTP